MNYSNILKNLLYACTFMGFLVLVGTVGTSDYYTELGINYPLSEEIPNYIFAALLMAPGLIVYFKGNR